MREANVAESVTERLAHSLANGKFTTSNVPSRTVLKGLELRDEPQQHNTSEEPHKRKLGSSRWCFCHASRASLALFVATDV